jgi:catechol 2,3-dioxygenase-like lactoylglutathione lyase family enzyme
MSLEEFNVSTALSVSGTSYNLAAGVSMVDALTRLFSDFDRGTISRRQLLQALGLAAVATPFANALGQGRCGGARAGTPGCDTTPAPPPFEPTGWKTVYMDHFSLQSADFKREAAFYVALMNWKIRSESADTIVLDIGDDVGSVMIRGGYVAPPAPAPRPVAAGDSAGGGRGGGRGNRAPVHAVWDGFCWGIEPWDAKKVEAELKKRGLNPVADNDGKDFQSFHVKDPDGFDLQISNGNRKNRRQGPANGQLSVALPFEHTSWKTVWLDHISFAVTNYKESAAFYTALLGWKPGRDEGSQNECQIGELGNIIIRGGGAGRGGRGGAGDTTSAPAPRRAVINHISFGIAPWDADAVKAELDKRGLRASPDTGGPLDIHDEKARYKSYHTTTPDGWDLQISNATRTSREVR